MCQAVETQMSHLVSQGGGLTVGLSPECAPSAPVVLPRSSSFSPSWAAGQRMRSLGQGRVLGGVGQVCESTGPSQLPGREAALRSPPPTTAHVPRTFLLLFHLPAKLLSQSGTMFSKLWVMAH